MKVNKQIDNRNIEIEVIMGNIVFQDADVIVNAAHENLMGGGGVDGAIHMAAGQTLLQECREIKQIEPGIRCRVGEAKLTSGGRLLTKNIIHTVAPKFVGSIVNNNGKREFKSINKNVDEDLKKCYFNCLKLASLNNFKSIAFPSLGTGGHSFPIELASEIAIKSTLEALKEAKSIQNVRFVCFSTEDYDKYVEVIRSIK